MPLKDAELILHRGGNPYVRIYEFCPAKYGLSLDDLKLSIAPVTPQPGDWWNEFRPAIVGDFLAIEIVSRDDLNLFKQGELRLGFTAPNENGVMERQFRYFVPML